MLALLMLIGCPKESCDPSDPSVRVTHASAPFAPLADGDILVAEMGPQGGWHTFVNVEVEGFDLAEDAKSQAELPAVTLTLSDGSGPIAGYAELPRAFTDDGQLPSERVVFIGDPAASVGAPLTFDAVVTDRCDASASFSRELTLSL